MLHSRLVSGGLKPPYCCLTAPQVGRHPRARRDSARSNHGRRPRGRPVHPIVRLPAPPPAKGHVAAQPQHATAACVDVRPVSCARPPTKPARRRCCDTASGQVGSASSLTTSGRTRYRRLIDATGVARRYPENRLATPRGVCHFAAPPRPRRGGVAGQDAGFRRRRLARGGGMLESAAWTSLVQLARGQPSVSPSRGYTSGKRIVLQSRDLHEQFVAARPLG